WLSYVLGALRVFILVLRPPRKLAQQRFALPAPAPQSVEAQVIEPTAPALDGSAAGATSPLGQTPQRIPVSPLLEDYDLPPPGSPVDVMVDHLKVLAAKEPERVAEVVKQWVQKNVRSE